MALCGLRERDGAIVYVAVAKVRGGLMKRLRSAVDSATLNVGVGEFGKTLANELGMGETDDVEVRTDDMALRTECREVAKMDSGGTESVASCRGGTDATEAEGAETDTVAGGTDSVGAVASCRGCEMGC